jgi:hypothetical protein
MKRSRWQAISIVVPDLEAATTRVEAHGSRRSTSSTAPGSVESSTVRRGEPAVGPKTRASTSGNSDDPPMPTSRTSVTPSATTPAAIRSRSGR